MKPDYLTPERAADLIPLGRIDGHLLCPHCRHVLYVGQKLGSHPRPGHKKSARKGASRARRPK